MVVFSGNWKEELFSGNNDLIIQSKNNKLKNSLVVFMLQQMI